MDIGVHLSLGRKPEASLGLASAAGADGVQIFASSPGAWRPPRPLDEEVEGFLRAREKHRIDFLFIHAIYLVNLASGDRVLASRSRGSLKATLKAGSKLHARGLITHIGSHLGGGFESVAEQVASGLVEVLAESPDDVDLVLENSAGSGGIIGSRLEELGTLLELAGRPERLKVAIDTAHLCASGWDLRDSLTTRQFVETLDELMGLDRLVAIHANDSKVPLGARVDRHAPIGEGHIGVEGFENLLAQPELRRLPWILETPDLGLEDESERFKSLRLLRDLAERFENVTEKAVS